MSKTSSSRATAKRAAPARRPSAPTLTPHQLRNQVTAAAANAFSATRSLRPMLAAAPPKSNTPVESQLLYLESLAEEMQNELHQVIDPLLPILHYDPRGPKPAADDAVDAEVASCPLEERLAQLKDHLRRNLLRLQEIRGAIRL